MGAEATKALQHLDFEAPPGSLSIKETRTLWNRYDLDNDGFLSGAELRTLCADWCEANGIRKDGMTTQDLAALSRTVDKVVAQMLATFDKNGDGSVSHDEFFGIGIQTLPEAEPELHKTVSLPVTAAAPHASASPDAGKKKGIHLFRQKTDKPSETHHEHKVDGNPYAIKLRSTAKPSDFHGAPKHHAGAAKAEEGSYKKPLDEAGLIEWAKKLEAQQAHLDDYAVSLARREAALAEREAKAGIASPKPGVSDIMFPPEQATEEAKLQHEMLARKKVLSIAAVQIDAPAEAAAKADERELQYAREAANQASDNFGTLV